MHCSLAIREDASNSNTPPLVNKAVVFDQLVDSLNLTNSKAKAKICRLLAVKAFTFLFPEHSQAVEEFRDPQTQYLQHVRLASSSEREGSSCLGRFLFIWIGVSLIPFVERANKVPPLTDEFKRELFQDLRREITRRTLSSSSGSTLFGEGSVCKA